MNQSWTGPKKLAAAGTYDGFADSVAISGDMLAVQGSAEVHVYKLDPDLMFDAPPESGQWILRQRERPTAGGSVMAN